MGIALHPNFHTDPASRFVYLYWTESTTGADTTVLSETPLLGNRVDRYRWNGTSLTPDRNLIRLRALQPPFDAEPTPAAGRGNHDGGMIEFGPDGKLYVFIGDVGRRGWMQNLVNGPYQPGDPRFGTDDSFGGPEPDDAHLTGVVLRLNDDGSTPTDNPFTDVGRVFVAHMDGAQDGNTSTAKGYGVFILNPEMTSLTFTATVAGIDFTGSQTADPGDDLVAAHIHAPAPRGSNAGVRFGFIGSPFNDTNPNDVVVTPFATGVGGTVTSKWDLTEGNNTTLTAQLPNILAGQSYINFHTRRLPGGEVRGQIEENPQVTANIHKVFSYGHRNSFGMAFDPKSGALWLEENGDDTFTELNRVLPGQNGGWIQVMGPVERIDAVQGDRDDHVRRQSAAVALAADQHRRHAGGGAVPAVHAARLALQRPGVQLEVRGGPGGDRLHGRPGPRPAVRRRPVRRRCPALPRRRLHLAHQPDRQPPEDRRR